MLKRIQIRDLAIIENLELELLSGMTVITGETGAGKSIVIDALDFALGDRADSKIVRHGSERCEVIVEFDLACISSVHAWLAANDLDKENTCIIRRVINAHDGRSRHYINGSLVSLNQLRELGRLLMHIHGQHQHQALVKRDEQRSLLDLYADHPDLLSQVQLAHQTWQQIKQQIEDIQISVQQEAEVALLRYQVEELQQLNLTKAEIIQLQQDHKQQANAELLVTQAQNVLSLLTDTADGNLIASTHQALNLLNNMRNLSPKVENAAHLLANIAIELAEVENEINDFLNHMEINPQQLQEIEHKLNTLYQLSRKHKITLEELPDYFIQLKTRLATLENAQTHINELVQQESLAKQQYLMVAEKLSLSRQKAATKLNQLVTQNMHQLGMPGGKFRLEITYQNDHIPTIHGLDKIEFLVSANPGQPLQPLAKVASGGELSRISLALQVITAEAVTTPALVFDEVDVGISGGTAEIVGKVLRKLGQHAQVLCITHLPQVAAQGHHHLLIHKEVTDGITHAHVTFLNQAGRIKEIARLLGGIKITQTSLDHAQAMLEEASSSIPNKKAPQIA